MSGLLKRVLVLYIKSVDLVEVLIFDGVEFIKVRVVIIEDPLKHPRSIFLQKMFSAKSH